MDKKSIKRGTDLVTKRTSEAPPRVKVVVRDGLELLTHTQPVTREDVQSFQGAIDAEEASRAQTPRFRTDLVEKLTPEDLLEGILENRHRYKPEPLLGTTGKGFLAPTTPEDRERDLKRIRKLQQKLKRG